jgi:septal ring factor EnvC (AmiA/AmiB activator)
MGKAIAVALAAVVLAFGFVLVQLLKQPPRDGQGAPRPGPVLEVREDGTLYSVNLQISQFERRLIDAEKRSEQLQAEVDTLRAERAQMEERLGQMHDEVRRLRRQVTERPAPPAPQPQPGPGSEIPAPTNSPAPGNQPVTPPEGPQ